MRRGEVYWADLVPRSGAEQAWRRPVIIISHDAFNQTDGWQSILVVPLSTSRTQAKRGPTAVTIPAKATSLNREGVAVCHQVTTLDRAKLTRFVGALPANVLAAVEEGLKAAMDLA